MLVWFSCGSVRFFGFALDQIRARRERFLGLDLDLDRFHGLRSAHFTTCATCTTHFRAGGGAQLFLLVWVAATRSSFVGVLSLLQAVYASVAEFSDHYSAVR